MSSQRVEVRPGQQAIAPNVDDPHSFAVLNQSGAAVTVSFRFDTAAHVMTVVIEGESPSQRPPDKQSLS